MSNGYGVIPPLASFLPYLLAQSCYLLLLSKANNKALCVRGKHHKKNCPG